MIAVVVRAVCESCEVVRFVRFECGRDSVEEMGFLRGVGLMIRMANVRNGGVMSDGNVGVLVEFIEFWNVGY